MKPLNKILVVAPLALAVGAGAWFLGRMTAVKDETISVSFEAVVTKVVDGDTVVAAGGDHVRLLGIDADEKGYPCYDAARLRLEELVLGKNVMLESDSEDADQYGRKLRYIFLDGANINEKMAAEGLAVARFLSGKPEIQKRDNSGGNGGEKKRNRMQMERPGADGWRGGCQWRRER